MRRDVGYWGLCLAGSVWLGGCATRQGTAQAMTVAGAAAVIVGASLAADNACAGATDDGGAFVHCSSRVSPGVRRAGTAMAIAGAGVAAAGYALQPKGPDRLVPARPSALPPPALSPRLVRPAAAAAAPGPASEASLGPLGGEQESAGARPCAAVSEVGDGQPGEGQGSAGAEAGSANDGADVSASSPCPAHGAEAGPASAAPANAPDRGARDSSSAEPAPGDAVAPEGSSEPDQR